MSTHTGPRYIYSRFGSAQVAEVLQAIFAAEILLPSKRVWLVSPWVSDIPLLDNRANSFSSLVPTWSRSRVTLSMVLCRLLEAGTVVHVATRGDEEHNRDFIRRMEALRQDHPELSIHLQSELHDKGVLTDGCFLAGSMNFTHSGISVNQEALHFTTDPAVLAEHHLTFQARWRRL
jgi:phosphatidylserine/phosphatidylglycerophosphate/cardiolipin synthase-like enzyme